MRPHRLARSRTPAFHAGDRGSNPLGDANKINSLKLSYTEIIFGNNPDIKSFGIKNSRLFCF